MAVSKSLLHGTVPGPAGVVRRQTVGLHGITVVVVVSVVSRDRDSSKASGYTDGDRGTQNYHHHSTRAMTE